MFHRSAVISQELSWIEAWQPSPGDDVITQECGAAIVLAVSPTTMGSEENWDNGGGGAADSEPDLANEKKGADAKIIVVTSDGSKLLVPMSEVTVKVDWREIHRALLVLPTSA